MGFLSPLLLTGLVLASVPLIIHLLNRRRFVVVEWAPMKHLKLTLKTNRRRLRLEQWLLLLIRTLVVVALILAVARPLLPSTGPGSWLTGSARTSRIIVLDDSLSTGYSSTTGSAFDRARKVLLDTLADIGSQDRVTIIRTSQPKQPLASELPAADILDQRATYETLKPTDTANQWHATLEAVDQWVQAASFSTRDVLIITDMQATGWEGDFTPLAARWKAGDTGVRVLDIGERAESNLALLALKREADDPILPDQDVKLLATVRYDGPETQPPAPATLIVGGQAQSILLPEIAPGRTVDVPITTRFAAAGTQVVQLQLAKDAMPADNARSIVLQVRDALKFVVVDGEPDVRPFMGETDFLHLALRAGRAGWQTDIVTDPADLLTLREMPDAVILANVTTLTQSQIDWLQEHVERGMGLIIYVGDLLDLNAYNELLYRNGEGLLPAALAGVSEEPAVGLVVTDIEGSPLLALAQLAPAALARIDTSRRMSVTLPADAGDTHRVLATWNDAEGTPAAIERAYGAGRVVLWTVPADKAWSTWPTDPTYVLATRSVAGRLARRGAAQPGVVAGEPVHFAIPGDAAGVSQLQITVPDQPQPQPVAASRQDNTLTAAYAATQRAGLYSMTWRDAHSREFSQPIAVNPSASESELDRLDDAALAARFGELDVMIIRPDTAGNDTGAGREVWRPLVMALLALMAMETVFAMWVGRER
jgi:hypothetical protein